MQQENREAMDKIVFLDRDGTINQEVEYLHRPEDLVILPEVAQALKLSLIHI